MKKKNMLNRVIFPPMIGVALLALALSGCGGSSGGSGSSTPSYVTFTSGQKASVVIGEPNFISYSGGTAQNLVRGGGTPTVVNGALYLPDGGNNRLLGFNAIPTGSDANADFVVGSTDFTSAGSLGGPTAVADYSGALYVDERNYNDIAIYNPVPTAATTAPLAATPAPNFTLTAATVGSLNGPTAVAAGGGRLVVTDTGHNRVLIWSTIPTSNVAPDLVLGQTSLTSGTSANQGLLAPTASTLSAPAGVWTDGTRLVVVDSANNRVLIWNSFPTSNDQAANLVLGQPDFVSSMANQGGSVSATTLSNPYEGVYAKGAQLFVADSGNGRVLIWNSWPTTKDQAADVVLGQAGFTTVTGGPSQSIMDGPNGVYLSGTQLIVGDNSDVRFLVFNGS